MEEIALFRRELPDTETTLYIIAQMLGFKPPKVARQGDTEDGKRARAKLEKSLPNAGMTMAEVRKHERAGYPPLKAWLEKERKNGNRRRNR